MQRPATGTRPHSTPTGAVAHNGAQHATTHHHNRHNTSRNTPDPSALHPFCSGAALRNGCSAPQQVQRTTTGAAPHNGCSATQQVQRTTTGTRPHSTPTGQRAIKRQPPHSTPTGAVAHNGAQHTTTTAATQAAVHPIRRHYTPSVRVQRHTTGAAHRNGCLPSDLCPARRRICNDDNSRTLDDRGGSYCFRPQHQPWHPVHRHATNRRSRHRTRRRLASCPPARDQPMLLRAAVAAFKTGVAVSQPSERYETVRHDAIASSCRSFLHVANAEEPTATATATATATSRNHHTLRSLGCARQRDITLTKTSRVDRSTDFIPQTLTKAPRSSPSTLRHPNQANHSRGGRGATVSGPAGGNVCHID